MGATFETVEGSGSLTAQVAGDLDVTTAPSIEEQLVALESREPDWVILDLRDVRFIDSTGLSLLINADRRGRKAGRRVTIICPGGPPRRILETTGLGSRLDIVDDAPAS